MTFFRLSSIIEDRYIFRIMATPEKPQHTPENFKDSIENFLSEIVRETKKFLSYL